MWDYAVAGAMVIVAIVALTTRIDVQDADAYLFHPDTAWSWIATIAVCATLVGRRRWPLRSFAIALALMLPLELGKHRDSIAFFALVIALYSVAACLPLRLAWRAVAMVAVLYTTVVAAGSTNLSAAPAIGNILLAAGFALGRIVRRNRIRQERDVEAAIERAAEAVETADLQAANERLRMARELHDVVAHCLSVIAVQAGIGVHLIDREPSEATRALEAIQTTSTTAAGELSRLVGHLRDGGSANSAGAPALTELAVLIEQIRAAGVPITYTTNRDLDTVPAGISLVAYRIVQEALTNVVRHAGQACATVTARVTDEDIKLTIDDDGRGAATAHDTGSRGGGNGLTGMRERAEMYGGEVYTGPRPGGGFRVQATLPYGASPKPNALVENAAVGPTGTRHATPARRSLPPWLWDIGLAGLVFGLATLQVGKAASTTIAYTPTNVTAVLLRVVCCLGLAVRRRFPTTSLAAVWVSVVALSIGNYHVGVITFVLWIGAYTVATQASTRRLIFALIGTYVGTVIVALSKPPDLNTAGAILVGFLLTASAVAGYVVRRDREHRTADLAERADAADAHSRRARLAIANERIRIADELSMIINRSIHTIANEAAAGSKIISTDPVAARESLESISTISREALNDLRRLLKRIRADSAPPIYAPVTPIPDVVAAGGPR
jgi:signal transduction histidine kinase